MENICGGYDFDMVGIIPAEYKCIICHLLLKETTGLPCSHAFCRQCLTKWEDNQIERNEILQRYHNFNLYEMLWFKL